MPARDELLRLAGISIKHTGKKVVITEISNSQPALSTDNAPLHEFKGVDPEEILLRVKRYYDGLWERVKRQAEEIGYREGYAKGYEEGYSKGISDARVKVTELLKDLEEKLSSLEKAVEDIENYKLKQENAFKEWLDMLEEEILSQLPVLIADITRELLGTAINTDEDILRGFLERALSSVKSAKRVEMQVPEELMPKVQNIFDDLKGILREAGDLKLVSGDGILIDTDVGVVDLRLDKIAQRVESVLRSAILSEDEQGKEDL